MKCERRNRARSIHADGQKCQNRARNSDEVHCKPSYAQSFSVFPQSMQKKSFNVKWHDKGYCEKVRDGQIHADGQKCQNRARNSDEVHCKPSYAQSFSVFPQSMQKKSFNVKWHDKGYCEKVGDGQGQQQEVCGIVAEFSVGEYGVTDQEVAKNSY